MKKLLGNLKRIINFVATRKARKKEKIKNLTKKERYARRNKIFFIKGLFYGAVNCALLVIIVCSILYIKSNQGTFINDTYNDAYYVFYNSYEIQKGDTVESISREFIKNYKMKGITSVKDMVYTISKINRIDPDHIHASNHLIVPYLVYKDDYEAESTNDEVVIEPNTTLSK
jgi:hypothetical protein